MFITMVEGREFSMKPMNCPSHVLIYKNQTRSYRDLPLRIADFAPLHRNELSGTLSGLTRVRKFSQDDAHIFCTAEQLEEELRQALDFVDHIYKKIFKMEYDVGLSTRPESFMGEPSLWNKAEGTLSAVLDELKIPYTINAGDGAFYGPKIDIRVRDALGRQFQCATIQLDFQMPLRFGATYEGADGSKHSPIMIHRAVLGSLERFFGIVVEHFAGRFPLWLSPEQVRILPIADRHNEYCCSVMKEMQQAGLRVTVDERPLTTNKKIREAELAKVNYILVVGDREVESQTVNVRTRDSEATHERKVTELRKDILEEIALRT
jgi:threonyl-tRNA synthetase